jgi:hypothetical protein
MLACPTNKITAVLFEVIGWLTWFHGFYDTVHVAFEVKGKFVSLEIENMKKRRVKGRNQAISFGNRIDCI